MNFGRLITEKQASELLAISAELLRKRRYLGDLIEGFHFVKIGAAVRYSPENIHAWATDSKADHARKVAEFLSAVATLSSANRGPGRPKKEAASRV